MNDIQTSLMEYTIRAKQILKRTAQDIIELSQIAHEVREQVGYQEYVRWVKEDLGIGEVMGSNLLNVYKRFGVTSNFEVRDIAPSALYLLSAPSTPEPARQEAIERAEAGEAISHKMAQEIAEYHKRIAALESQRDNLQSEKQAIENQLAQTESDRQRAIELEGRIIEANNRVNAEIKGRLSAERELDELRRKPPVIQEKVIEKEVVKEVPPGDYDQIKSDVQRLRDQLNAANHRAGNAETVSKVHQDTNRDLRRELSKKEAELAKYEVIKRETETIVMLTDVVKNIKKVVAYWTVDGRVLHEVPINLKRLVQSCADAMQELNEITNFIDVAGGEIHDI